MGECPFCWEKLADATETVEPKISNLRRQRYLEVMSTHDDTERGQQGTSSSSQRVVDSPLPMNPGRERGPWPPREQTPSPPSSRTSN